jgi:hypothetical protein
VVNGFECSRKVEESETCDLFERYSIDDVIVDRKQSSLGRMVFCVGRLVGVEERISREVSSEARFDDAFS